MRTIKLAISLARTTALVAFCCIAIPTNAQQPVTLGPVVCPDSTSSYVTFSVDSTTLLPGQMAHLTVTVNGSCYSYLQLVGVVGTPYYLGPYLQPSDPYFAFNYWLIQDQGGTYNPPQPDGGAILDFCEEGIPCATTGELGIGYGGSAIVSADLYWQGPGPPAYSGPSFLFEFTYIPDTSADMGVPSSRSGCDATCGSDQPDYRKHMDSTSRLLAAGIGWWVKRDAHLE